MSFCISAGFKLFLFFRRNQIPNLKQTISRVLLSYGICVFVELTLPTQNVKSYFQIIAALMYARNSNQAY
jgi:hypothetical protein